MKKLKYGMAGLLITVLVAIWWSISDEKEHSEVFLYQSQGELSWFELTIQNNKIEGTFHQQKIMEYPGQHPTLDAKTYPLKGKNVENEYELQVNMGGKNTIYTARMAENELFIQVQGEQGGKVYKATNEEELQASISGLQEEFELAVYHAEYKENERIRTFFENFRSAYGYLYTSEDQTIQLFITVDEALLEGEVSGSLLMVTKENNTYEESTYPLNGITDGLMIQLHTTVDGKETKLEGNYLQEDASSFDLSFWGTNEKLIFRAVTEEEYQKANEEFNVVE